MSQSLIILGRQPALGLAELESLLSAAKIQPIGDSAVLLDLHHNQVPFDRLGGSIKLAKLLHEFPENKWRTIEKYLIQNLAEHLKFKDLAGVLRIGCVQIAPYFSFSASDDPEMPDSRLHPVVTQSALFHYGTTPVGYDRVYLLGAPELPSTNEGQPVSGGPEQLNRAHYAELAAGLAVTHFFRDPPAARAGKASAPTVWASYSNSTDYSDFPEASSTELRRNLVSFATTCALHAIFIAPDLANRTRDEFMKVMERQLGVSIEVGNPDFKSFTEFSTRFLAWIIEVNERAPQLLTPGFAKTVRALLGGPVEGMSRAPESLLAEVAPNSIRGTRSPYKELLHDRMNAIKQGDIVQSRPMGFYLDRLTWATDDYCKKTYQSW